MFFAEKQNIYDILSVGFPVCNRNKFQNRLTGNRF